MRSALQSDTFDHWINWSLHNLLRRTDAPEEARARGKQRERKVGNQPPIRRRSSPPATPGPSSIYAIFVQRFCRSWNLKTRPKSRTSETEEYPTDEPRRHWDTKKARCRFPELFRFVYITRPFRFSAWKGIPIPSFMDEEGARTHSKCVRFGRGEWKSRIFSVSGNSIHRAALARLREEYKQKAGQEARSVGSPPLRFKGAVQQSIMHSAFPTFRV